MNICKKRIFCLIFILNLMALFAAWKIRDPQWADFRKILRFGFVLSCVSGVCLLLFIKNFKSKIFTVVSLVIFLSAATVFTFKEVRFLFRKQFVLKADPSQLSKWGSHFIVGYKNESDLRVLIEKNAIAGVYFTTRNWRGKNFNDVQSMIANWQNLRQQSGHRSLWIAADQEGGSVSRLSPLLPQLPPLSTLSQAYETGDFQSVALYAKNQAHSLNELGINLNLSPVVDLQDPDSVMLMDFHSRIFERAISSNPKTVGGIASIYCKEARSEGVTVTLKHFPGLGSVRGDTHLGQTFIQRDKSMFMNTDWLPYRQVFDDCTPAVMMSHVTALQLDPDHPASVSKIVVHDILRRELGFSGLIVTDDFCMAAISGRPGGAVLASQQALAAGVDLILISFDPDLYYEVLYGLLTS